MAKQILIYPMLDDRNTTPGSLPAQLLTWSYDNNYTGWVTLLGDALGGDDVVHPGAPHDFERFVPDAGVARRAMADRVRAVATI